MADALCGPSNSLQVLQKHVSTDRTFQQDRVFAHRSPLEGFRSSQGVISGALDAEFEAFHAAQPSGSEVFGHDFFNPDAATNPLIRDLNDHQLPSWALDFQALQVNEYRTSPISSSQFRERAPLQLNLQKGRHPGVTRPKAHAITPFEIQRKPQSSVTLGRTHQTDYKLLNQHPYDPFSTQALRNFEPDYREREPFDDDAIQRAFDAAEKSVSDSADHRQQEIPAHPQIALVNPKPENSAPVLDFQSTSKDQVTSDGKLESTSESQHEVHDADELARTAGELLNRVKHDTNPKFQNSSFLSLMRQLRDREVHVEGDRIVNTAHPLHPGGEFYPHTSTHNYRDGVESRIYDDTTMTWATHNDYLEA